MPGEEGNKKCWRCRGDGYFYRVPDGFNPFYAGGFQTAAASYRVECYTCNGTGKNAGALAATSGSEEQ